VFWDGSSFGLDFEAQNRKKKLEVGSGRLEASL